MSTETTDPTDPRPEAEIRADLAEFDVQVWTEKGVPGALTGRLIDDVEPLLDALLAARVSLTQAQADALTEFEWAEGLVHQSCPAGKHTEWWVNSENHHRCPWCAIEVERADALREAADALDLPGSDARGYYASEHHAGYLDAEKHAEQWLRSRAASLLVQPETGKVNDPTRCTSRMGSHRCVKDVGHDDDHGDSWAGWPVLAQPERGCHAPGCCSCGALAQPEPAEEGKAK